MIPNNNLSVLPWYTSIEQQNARKWWVYGRIYPLFTQAMFLLPFQIIREHRAGTTIASFKIFKADGEEVADYTTQINNQIAIKSFASLGYDVIVYTGNLPFVPAFFNGQYYAVMSDGTETWYSEIFTVVNDIEPYLKIKVTRVIDEYTVTVNFQGFIEESNNFEHICVKKTLTSDEIKEFIRQLETEYEPFPQR